MSRSGYIDDTDDIGRLNLYRAAVERSMKGSRGQKFLKDLAAEMDSMPEKILISDDLIDEEGNCCAIGVVCKARGIDVSGVDVGDPESVGSLVDISRSMAAEIEFENDCDFSYSDESPEDRWVRMRKWVDSWITKGSP